MDAARFFAEGDAVTRTVAVLLLLLSVTSWVLVFWKAWLLRDAATAVARSVAGFWQAPSVADARRDLPAFDTQGLVLPFLGALDGDAAGGEAGLAGTGSLPQRRTRLLRGALHAASARLQFGQVLLASTGAIAPFVGLLGTVWGIHHALVEIAGAGQITIERIAGPVGEALVMTAAGLAVAIPAVLAYNLFGRRIARIEADLEGFAQDLRDL
ncbi:MAG: MotA/TolQ/ExbB proton channel family protein [Pseudomonadota bacterium]